LVEDTQPEEITVEEESKPKQKKVVTKRKATTVKKESPSEPVSRSRGDNQTVISNIATLLITALVVGGAIYAWQRIAVKDDLENAEKNVTETKLSFEKKIADLKDKMKAVIDENDNLKQTSEELSGKLSNLLKGAVKEYENEDLGLSFTYPAALGVINLEVVDGQTGKMFVATFSENDEFMFGGATKDYAASGTPATSTLLLVQDWYIKSGMNKIEIAGAEAPITVKPLSVITASIGDVMILDSSCFTESDETNEESMAESYGLGQDVAAILSYDKPANGWNAMAFVNKNFARLSMEDFEAMMSTLDND